MNARIFLIVSALVTGCDKPAPVTVPEPEKPPFAKFGAPVPDGEEVGRFVLHQGANFMMRMDTETGMTWVFNPESGKWGIIIEAEIVGLKEQKPATKFWR